MTLAIPYKRITYKVAPEDSRLWKCNWRICAGGVGLSNCGICNFRGRWDTSYCPLFITIGNLEAKGNLYKKWCKVAESAVGVLRYYICGKEIILEKKIGQFEIAQMESWMDFKGKAPSPQLMDILDCLKILHDQGQSRVITTTLEDLVAQDDTFVHGIDDSFISVKAKIKKYAKNMGFDIKVKQAKDNSIYIYNKIPKQEGVKEQSESKQNAVDGEKEEGANEHEHIGVGEEVQGREQAVVKEVL